MEAIRDLSAYKLWDESYLRKAVVLHEIGHTLFLDHPVPNTTDGSNGIMEEATAESAFKYPYFTAKYLRRLRCADHLGTNKCEFPSQF